MLEPDFKSLEEIKKVFNLALTKKWDINIIEQNPFADRPGKHRENVFDFEDTKIRMIASIDYKKDIGSYLHLSYSISIHPDSINAKEFFQKKVLEYNSIFSENKALFEGPVFTKYAVHFFFSL